MVVGMSGPFFQLKLRLSFISRGGSEGSGRLSREFESQRRANCGELHRASRLTAALVDGTSRVGAGTLCVCVSLSDEVLAGGRGGGGLLTIKV